MSSDIAGYIKNKIHYLNVRIYYEDTDFSGVVYHANYLKFSERGRSDFLRLVGINHSDLIAQEDAGFFVVLNMYSEFLQSSKIDDILSVKSSFVSLNGARLNMRQDILKDNHVIFKATTEFAFLKKNGKPRKVPDDIVKKIEPYLF